MKLLSVRGCQLYLCVHQVLCHRGPFSGLYLRGWTYDFNMMNKFTSQSFKNTLVTWRCPWNVSVTNIVLIASITSILQWSSSVPVMRKGMVWTEQASKCLPEIFQLVLCSRVWVFSLCKGFLPGRLGSSIMFMAQRPHVFCGGGGKLLRAIKLLKATWEILPQSPGLPE